VGAFFADAVLSLHGCYLLHLLHRYTLVTPLAVTLYRWLLLYTSGGYSALLLAAGFPYRCIRLKESPFFKKKPQYLLLSCRQHFGG